MNQNYINCNKEHDSSFCQSCSLGKHLRLPFYDSNSTTFTAFDIYSCWFVNFNHLHYYKKYILFGILRWLYSLCVGFSSHFINLKFIKLFSIFVHMSKLNLKGLPSNCYVSVMALFFVLLVYILPLKIAKLSAWFVPSIILLVLSLCMLHYPRPTTFMLLRQWHISSIYYPPKCLKTIFLLKSYEIALKLAA